MNPPSPPLCAARVRTNTIAYKRILHTRALTRADTPSSPACARTHVPRRTRAHESARTSERARGGAGGAGGERHGRRFLCAWWSCARAPRACARTRTFTRTPTHSHTRTAAHPHTNRRFRTRTLACTSARPHAGAITRTHARSTAAAQLLSSSAPKSGGAPADTRARAHAPDSPPPARAQMVLWPLFLQRHLGWTDSGYAAMLLCGARARAHAVRRAALSAVRTRAISCGLHAALSASRARALVPSAIRPSLPSGPLYGRLCISARVSAPERVHGCLHFCVRCARATGVGPRAPAGGLIREGRGGGGVFVWAER